MVYGPDGGLVAERAATIAAASADPADPFSLIKLDAADLGRDPSRLADEAYAVSMFGGRRAILVRDAGTRPTVATAVTALLKTPPPETVVVLEAGDLKKSHALRTLVERDKTAYALPCYVDDDAAIGRLIDQETKAAGVSIAPDAREALIGHLGGDRLVSRGEVQKVCLFALHKGRIELADVQELVGDSSTISAEEVVDAAALGDMAGLMAALTRAASEGVDANALAGTGLRVFQMLDDLRADVDAGRRPEDVVDVARPPIFFKRKQTVIKALRLWTPARLERALALLADAVRDARLNPALANAIIGDILLRIARVAAQAQGRNGR
nr:DNA polymerase III subunit delta [Chthonobacter rhizosphaerae]